MHRTRETTMESYPELVKQKAIIELNLKKIKKQDHKKLIKEKKVLLRFLDILVIIAIISNLGAVILTNILVLKESPEIQQAETFQEKIEILGAEEANPIQAEINNYKTSEKIQSMFLKIILNMFLWSILLGIYAVKRTYCHEEKNINSLILLVFIIATFTIKDFINNLGYIVGLIL